MIRGNSNRNQADLLKDYFGSFYVFSFFYYILNNIYLFIKHGKQG